MILAITNSLLYHAETIADMEALGTDDGITGDTVAWVEATKGWYYPDTTSAGGSTWKDTNISTSGFAGSEIERFSDATQDTLAAAASNQLIATLGTLDTNGQNMKISVKVTGVDNAVDTNFIAYSYEQHFYMSGLVINTVTAFDNQTGTAGVGDFTSNVTFNVTAVGNDIRLRASNGSSTATYVMNLAYSWTRQEGGFNS